MMPSRVDLVATAEQWAAAIAEAGDGEIVRAGGGWVIHGARPALDGSFHKIR